MAAKQSTAAPTTYPNLPAVDPAVELSKASTGDDIKVFITTWNMGNAEAAGLDCIFHEKNVAGEYDIVCVGLQESTYGQGGGVSGECVTQLMGQLAKAVGPDFYLVSCLVLVVQSGITLFFLDSTLSTRSIAVVSLCQELFERSRWKC
jgi:hypothetical protein